MAYGYKNYVVHADTFWKVILKRLSLEEFQKKSKRNWKRTKTDFVDIYLYFSTRIAASTSPLLQEKTLIVPTIFKRE